MNTENWIIAFGAGILLTVIVVAMFPDDLWDDDMHYTSHVIGNAVGIAPSGPQGRRRGTAPSSPVMAQQVPINTQQPGLTPQATYGQPARGLNVAMPAGRGLVPFTAARTEVFSGTVLKVHKTSSGGQGWGQVHVWVSQRRGGVRELSLGPDWYLEYMGCTVAANMFIKGVGFDFGSTGTVDSQLYAKDVTINGAKCRLRNDEGFALWSNRLR